MLDIQYIEEIRQLETRDAKDKLGEYAKTFGIEVKKTRSFDNMLLDIEKALKDIASEPMPESNEGLSISDLIDSPEESKPTEQLLVGQIGCPIGDITVVYDNGDVVTVPNKGLTEEDIPLLKEAVNKIIASEAEAKAKFTLPENYSPKMALIGRAPGYITLPWWIYQWISENEDWKDRPKDFSHPTAHDTLFTLIYYINRDGSVIVRETKNSRFVTLK